MKGPISVVAVFVLTVVAACGHMGSAQAPTPPSEEAFMSAFNAHDAGALADLYTVDAILLPPDAARVDGRPAIGEFWQGAFDAGFTNLVLEPIEIDVLDDTAIDVGTFALDAPGENGDLQSHAGKYVVVWKYGADGAWRLHRDIWNNDPPPTN